MLDRTAEIQRQKADAETHGDATPRATRRHFDTIRRIGQSAWGFFVSQSFSSLTRRIVFLNLTGLIALLAGVLYLSQFRAGLIDARVQSLLVQSEIIAGAIAASATVETDSITIDPDRLLELQAGQSYGPSDDALSGIEFPINPERVAPVLRRLVSPTKTRARIYDRDGRADPRQPQSLRPRRRAAFRSAAADGGKARLDGARLLRRAPLVRPRRSADLQRARPGKRQGLSGSYPGTRRPARQHGAGQRPAAR